TGRVRFLARDTAIYGLGNALVKLSGLIVVPILTRNLSREEFGASEVIAVSAALGVAFSTMGQDWAAARLFYDVDSESKRRSIVSQGLFIQLLLCFIATGVLFWMSPWLLSRVLDIARYSTAFRLAAATVPLALLFQFWRSLLKWTFARAS